MLAHVENTCCYIVNSGGELFVQQEPNGHRKGGVLHVSLWFIACKETSSDAATVLHITLNARYTRSMKLPVCFVNKSIKFFKSKRKQI